MMPPAMDARTQQPSPRFWSAMLGLSVLLVLGGLYAFYAASTRPRKAAAPVAQEVRVEIRDGACHPADITLPAGRTRFVIVNQSQRALEWEILDGVMVVDERENITPGMTQSLTLRLQPGEFQITCGLLSSPRGRLRVLPTAESELRARAPQMVDFIGVLAEYRVYSLLRLAELHDALEQVQAAWQAGDVVQAQLALHQIYAGYASLAPAVQSFYDLDMRLDVRADYLAQREQDAAYTGWRSLNHVLSNPVNAQQQAHGEALILQARSDLALLEQRVRTLQLTPLRMLQGTALAWRRHASHASTADGVGASADAAAPRASERELDLAYESGLAEGTRKVAELLQAVISRQTQERWTAIAQALAPWPAELVETVLAGQPVALRATTQQQQLEVATALEQAAEHANLE
jgi:iron uptake system EfeUOB component EfeO/EfeM